MRSSPRGRGTLSFLPLINFPLRLIRARAGNTAGDVRVRTHLGHGRHVNEGQLLALAIAWAAEDDDWKECMMVSARRLLMKNMEEEGARVMTPAGTGGGTR